MDYHMKIVVQVGVEARTQQFIECQQSEDIIIDYDNGGNIVGIEVLDASQHVDIENISISTKLESQEEAKTVRQVGLKTRNPTVH